MTKELESLERTRDMWDFIFGKLFDDIRRSKMDCPKCKEEMDYEDAIHHWNIRTWFCGECGYEIDEDITGDLIDYAMAQKEGGGDGKNKD